MKKILMLFALFTISFYGYAMEPNELNSGLHVLIIKFLNYHHLIEGNQNLYAASVEKDFEKLNDFLQEINSRKKERALTLNLRKQSVAKMYRCEDCKELFIFHHKRPHKRWHRKNTNYNCELCKTAYETKRSLGEHLKTVSHKEKTQ